MNNIFIDKEMLQRHYSQAIKTLLTLHYCMCILYSQSLQYNVSASFQAICLQPMVIASSETGRQANLLINISIYLYILIIKNLTLRTRARCSPCLVSSCAASLLTGWISCVGSIPGSAFPRKYGPSASHSIGWPDIPGYAGFSPSAAGSP